MASKTIHELTLGEITTVGEYEVTRVPGGWIYMRMVINGSVAVFVPEIIQSAEKLLTDSIQFAADKIAHAIRQTS